MRNTFRLLGALVAGLLLGLLLQGQSGALVGPTLSLLGVVGTLFLNGIRMPVIPLVAAAVIGGIAHAAASDGTARVARRTTLFAALSLLATAAVSALLASWLLGAVTAGALPGVDSGAAAPPPNVMQWITDLVPANPLKAAVDGALLPLLVFAVAVGVAARSMGDETRHAVGRGCDLIRDLMARIVGMVLRAAPLGIFAIAVTFAARTGRPALAALASYLLVVTVGCALAIAALYVVVALMTRVPVRRFARALLPAQLVAFATRSSLAAFPAMLTGTRDVLQCDRTATDVVLPLALSMYRLGAAVGMMVSIVLIGQLAGTPLSPAALAGACVLVSAMSLAIPGIPGGIIVGLLPVLATLGLPTAPAALLYGVDPLLDMSRTTLNVSGQFTLAVLSSRDDEALETP